MGLSRRALIIGSGLLGAAAGVGGWALLADARVAPGRSVLDDALGRCDITAPPTTATPGRMIESSFYSTHRKRSVNYVLAYPPKAAGGAKLPVCLVLHGAGADARTGFDGIGYQHLLADVVSRGTPPFILAAIDGGPGYWHPHADDDPLGALLTDFPVILTQHGLPTNRFGLLGWSMGGFGALLAATEAPGRFPVVTASAPALWRSFDEATAVDPAAFGSAEEWRRWGDLRARADKLKNLTVRIDCGESDSFAPALGELRERLPDPTVVHLAKGCHDTAFWRHAAPEQLRLIGKALKR